MRFDDLVRSERYFTATLLPAVLFHDDLRGLREFLRLINERSKTETSPSGARQGKRFIDYDLTDVEVIAEFHIARDLAFGGHLRQPDDSTNDEDGGLQRRDAPDIVLIAGRDMVVCEGKFFGPSNSKALNAQLASQRTQIGHLFAARPELRAYRHIAIIPESPSDEIDADAVLTWSDIADFSADVMGPSHYVTIRLRNAVERFGSTSNRPSGVDGRSGSPNFDGVLSLDEVLTICRDRQEVEVGHTGGRNNLIARGLRYARRKQWKWRDARTNRGVVIRANWIAGSRFVELIESLDDGSGDLLQPRVGRGRSRRNNYDGVVSFAGALELAKTRGNKIQIGHSGGERDLRSRGLGYARGKSWKWRDPSTNGGKAVPANWLDGTEFVRIVESM